MAKKSRNELLSDYTERIDKCKKWRNQQGYEITWRRLIDLYKGKHWPSTTSNQQDLIAVNLAFSTVNVIAPSVAVNYPKIVVQATQEDNADRAAFVEAIVNYLWKHHNFRTNKKGIFAIGDICTYPGKLRLILSGFHEGALASRACFKLARPNEKYRFEFTTTSKNIKEKLGIKTND